MALPAYLQANLWIAIFSYVGNYFWTHYFYKVLHAYYTFPVDMQLNRVRLAEAKS
jgi:cycloeucalenol cycloisomerase